MSKQHEHITPEMAAWIAAQRMFFVGTAPLADDGHVNVSPKGGDSFRVLGPLEAVYRDVTGSGAETAAHLRENGRLVVMFCAFDGAPQIVRLHGRGTLIAPDDARFAELAKFFPPHPGTRAIIHLAVTRVSDSCGWGVPLLDFRAERDALEKWAIAQGPEKLAAYRAAKNSRSVDGLPGFPAP